MDLEKLEKLAKSVQERLSRIEDKGRSLSIFRARKAKIKGLLVFSSKAFPEYDEFFKSVAQELGEYDIYDAIEAVEYILEILEIEKSGEKKIKAMKIFESAEEKLRQAGLSFRNDDHPSTFNNLNTALELILKDKCEIPTTITDINTSNVIDRLVKYKVEPYAYFAEARKRVSEVANRVKHQAYIPSKREAILGIKAMEELISKLRDKEIKLTEEIRNKIYQGL